MGIFGALTTAVSGLQAQSFALENISGNIANSSTTGFKRTDTSFADLVLGGEFNARRQVSGSVSAFSRATNDLQGTLAASSSTTSLAIKGSGFLMVQAQTGEADGNPTFAGSDLYTRRGDFELDRNGYMVNGAGYFLMGERLDPVTGNGSGSNEVIKLGNDFYPATATTSVDYRANLPTVPRTSNYAAGEPGSWLLDPTITGDVTGDQTSAFLDSSITGDAVTVYDAMGGAYDLQLRWGKVSNADASATPPTADTWAMYYQSNAGATGTDVSWTKVGDFAFNSAGALTSPAGGTTTIPGLTIDGVSLGDVALSNGAGLTQFADSDGAVATKALTQNGAASGQVVSIEVADGGAVTATYSNGKSRPLYKIPVVAFQAENRLAQLDGGAYAATVASGQPAAATDAQIIGGALEQSNVDIADEFTKMIVTQQAYSANTRVVTTSDNMMQATLSMIR